VRQLVILVGLIAAAVAAAAGAWGAARYLGQESQYRRLLEDGDRFLAAGDSIAAIEAFSGAITLRGQSMVAHYRRGEAHLSLRQFDQANRDLREAARLESDAPQPLVSLGRLHELRGEHLEAARMYERAAETLRAEDPALLYTLALARYRAGAAANAPASAEQPLLQIVARPDAFPEAYYLLGLVRRDTRNFDGAAQALETAVRLSPDLSAAREELADLYRQMDRPVDEMRHLQQLALSDRQAHRQVTMALAELRHGQPSASLATLSAASAADPHDSRVQLALGRVHLAQAERGLDPVSLDQARTALEKALGGTARRSEGLALFGRVLHLSGDLPGAETLLRDAVATTPVAPEAFAYLADAAEQLGHALDARDALVNLDAVQGDTASAEVRAARARRIGALSLAGNDARGALPYLMQAHAGGHTDSATLGLIARARWLTGDTAGAQQTLRQALTLDPSDPELQRLARAIGLK
jgi:tetratricopeptide (TPR) repeat protein